MPYVVSFVSARNLILQSVPKCMHSFIACTPIYEHQKDDAYLLPQGNQEPLLVRDRVGRPQHRLGLSKSMECDTFFLSALTLLVGRQEVHPTCKKNWMLVCWW